MSRSLPDQTVRELAPGELQQYTVIRVAAEILVDLMCAIGGIDYAAAVPEIVTKDVGGVAIPFVAPVALADESRDAP